jgi:hypothetical protein
MTLRTLIDNTGPMVTVLGPKDEIKGIAKFKIQVTDPSGVDRVMIRIGGGEWREMRYEEGQYVYRWKTTEEDNGDQPYDIKVVDKLGNEEILAYSIVVNNPTEKKVLPWWVWLAMLCLLIGVVLGVAVASRPTASSRERMRDRGMDRRMAGRERPRGRHGPGGPRPPPGRARGDPHKVRTSKDLTTPAHKAAMRKLESEDVVVQKPQEDEVEFLSMDEGPAHEAPRGVAVAAPLTTVSDLDDEVTFDEDDEVSFHEDDEVTFNEDEVSFHEDDEVTFDEDDVSFEEDEVSFHDDDEVSFDEDDDVEFLDDDDEVEFLDDGPPPPGPPSRTTPRRVPLTPRATAKPARTSSPPVSSSTMKGIDDLLAGPPKKGPSAPSRLPKASAPKPKKSSSSDDPLGDVIGGL